MSRRISKKEILDETLKLLAKQRDKTLTTSELINLLTTEFEPAGKDSEIIQGRSDTYFSQKVRNIISHRNEDNGIVTRGLASYSKSNRPGSLTITPQGESYIARQ